MESCMRTFDAASSSPSNAKILRPDFSINLRGQLEPKQRRDARLGLLLLRALQSDDERDLELELGRGGDDALGDDVAAHDLARSASGQTNATNAAEDLRAVSSISVSRSAR